MTWSGSMAGRSRLFRVSHHLPVPPTGGLTVPVPPTGQLSSSTWATLSHLEGTDNVREGRGLLDDGPEAPRRVLRLSGWEAKELKGAATLRPPGRSGQAVSGPLPMSPLARRMHSMSSLLVPLGLPLRGWNGGMLKGAAALRSPGWLSQAISGPPTLSIPPRRGVPLPGVPAAWSQSGRSG